MDRNQLVARALADLAAARAAITASYMRLWRPAERTLADPGASNLPGVDHHRTEISVAPEEHRPRDAGE